jgi:hypothetical protein
MIFTFLTLKRKLSCRTKGKLKNRPLDPGSPCGSGREWGTISMKKRWKATVMTEVKKKIIKMKLVMKLKRILRYCMILLD